MSPGSYMEARRHANHTWPPPGVTQHHQDLLPAAQNLKPLLSSWALGTEGHLFFENVFNASTSALLLTPCLYFYCFASYLHVIENWGRKMKTKPNNRNNNKSTIQKVWSLWSCGSEIKRCLVQQSMQRTNTQRPRAAWLPEREHLTRQQILNSDQLWKEVPPATKLHMFCHRCSSPRWPPRITQVLVQACSLYGVISGYTTLTLTHMKRTDDCYIPWKLKQDFYQLTKIH